MFNLDTNHTPLTHLLISCNPNPKSLTCTIAEKIQTDLLAHGISSNLWDLYEMQYNPILQQEEINRKASFEEQTLFFQKTISPITTLVLFYPEWWGFPPAMLVGWMQRVLAPGVAFVHDGAEFMPKQMTPLLSHINVILAVCSDELDVNKVKESTELLQQRVFVPCGISQIHTAILSPTHSCTTHTINQWKKTILNMALAN